MKCSLCVASVRSLLQQKEESMTHPNEVKTRKEILEYLKIITCRTHMRLLNENQGLGTILHHAWREPYVTCLTNENQRLGTFLHHVWREPDVTCVTKGSHIG
ncbi:hypothetical protein AVEN_230181-1 [Araneus ventricosus]|uniref:Uncharacterized protein n=1 Tax=Araneus ventricosus TaxID=182803 RepID=A0A4Y2LV84_ARAVE|nr:hypothetical protein AVEN_230181-1 [Araneus ventricosus]